MRGVGKSCKLQYRRIRWFSSRLEPTESISAINNKLKDLMSRQQYAQTLKLYKDEIHPSGFHPSTFILLPSIIKACSLSQFQQFGFQLHCLTQKSGADSDFVISNSLISMYAKFSSIISARNLFDLMPHRDTITYNAMINCYTQYGDLFKTMEILKEMISCGFVLKPDLIAGVLSLCARMEVSIIGKAVHGLVVASGMTGVVSVLMSTALVDMYLRFGETTMAFYLFGEMELKNEVTWTSMISGCIINHRCDIAIDCFRAMQSERINPNRITLVTVLSACEKLCCIRLGKEIHCYVFRHRFELDNHVVTALINMYCQHGCSIHRARLVFKLSEAKDVVMWTSMIGSYARRGDCVEAMKHFNEMQKGFRPNSVTLLELTSVSSTLCSINHGDGVHCCIVKYGFKSDVFVGNALVNMYAKCGCLRSSCQIFEEMCYKDSVSWSSMISAYGKHGYGEKGLAVFNEMREMKMDVDAMSWLAVLSACNYSGLLKEGEELFNEALKGEKVLLTAEHYACYIDLLGRSGRIDDACDALHKMPIKPNAKIWSCLVSACKVHGRSDIAEILGGFLVESEPDNPANYALLSIIHAQSGNWVRTEEMRNVMKVHGLKKCCGFSRIELGS